DGYRDFHDHAYPVLKELGIPAAVFLSTELMDNGRILWTEALEWAVMQSPRDAVALPWSQERCTLESTAARRAFVRKAKEHLKGAADAERRAWCAELIDSLGAPDPLATLGRQMLSWDEVRSCSDGTIFG